MHGNSSGNGASAANGKAYIKDKLGQLKETKLNNRFDLA